jgi:hypothetical protein
VATSNAALPPSRGHRAQSEAANSPRALPPKAHFTHKKKVDKHGPGCEAMNRDFAAAVAGIIAAGTVLRPTDAQAVMFRSLAVPSSVGDFTRCLKTVSSPIAH